jgi:hypothetical protein
MDALADTLSFGWLHRSSFWPCCGPWGDAVAPIDLEMGEGGDLYYHFNIKPKFFDDVKDD